MFCPSGNWKTRRFRKLLLLSSSSFRLSISSGPVACVEMQKSGRNKKPEDDCVRDSWEELEEDLDHMVVVTPEPKKNESSKREDSLKSTVEQDGSQLPSNQSSNLDSAAPEPGKVRILKRNPTPVTPNSASLPAKVTTPTSKTYEERIRNYNEARLRILGSIDDEVESQLQRGGATVQSNPSDPSSVR